MTQTCFRFRPTDGYAAMVGVDHLLSAMPDRTASIYTLTRGLIKCSIPATLERSLPRYRFRSE